MKSGLRAGGQRTWGLGSESELYSFFLDSSGIRERAIQEIRDEVYSDDWVVEVVVLTVTLMCMCVCVCVRERERQRQRHFPQQTTPISSPHPSYRNEIY